jgi:hypothetical protein
MLTADIHRRDIKKKSEVNLSKDNTTSNDLYSNLGLRKKGVKGKSKSDLSQYESLNRNKKLTGDELEKYRNLRKDKRKIDTLVGNLNSTGSHHR